MIKYKDDTPATYFVGIQQLGYMLVSINAHMVIGCFKILNNKITKDNFKYIKPIVIVLIFLEFYLFKSLFTFDFSLNKSSITFIMGVTFLITFLSKNWFPYWDDEE